ncbi:MAG: T9SS type A sorting domain-containing protein, partial [Phaeodactylibacter sp.]|nr:T9SS type A sorting domain-containing protein [Phaeodactylibacter sp.]
GDGVCADVDCDDNDPNITSQVGQACDDGDPNTFGETIQNDCSCGGGVSNVINITSCSRVDHKNDDAEERENGDVKRGDKELELAVDPDHGSQLIGMRFNNLNIPQGAQITNASIQFTVKKNDNDNPCQLTIYGEANDDASGFSGSGHNISGRTGTNATVSWPPPEWTSSNDDGPDQQTPNIAAIIQEIVNRGGYSSSSSIVLIIEGSGLRVAKSYNGSSSEAPELCVQYVLSSAPGSGGAMERNKKAANKRFPATSLAEKNSLKPISAIQVYPNPANDRLMLSFNSTFEGQGRIQVINLEGRPVLTKERAINPGENKITLEELSLPDGMYFLQLFTGDTAQSARFIILRE